MAEKLHAKIRSKNERERADAIDYHISRGKEGLSELFEGLLEIIDHLNAEIIRLNSEIQKLSEAEKQVTIGKKASK